MLLVLVLVHEFGHFYSAKKFGMRVDEFGFGFPPKLFTILKKGDTEYTFNLLPLGGFVRIFGESEQEVIEAGGEDKDRSFGSKPAWQQAIVLLAGIFANFVLAWLLLSFGFMSGLPTSVNSDNSSSLNIQDASLVVVSVEPDSPAETSGLKTGDKVISLSTENEEGKIYSVNTNSLKNFVLANGENDFYLTYKRGHDMEEKTLISPMLDQNSIPKIGIGMDDIGIAKLSFFPALLEGFKLNAHITKNTTLGLYNLLTDSLKGQGDISSITGPVGIVGMVGDAYDFGLAYLLSFAALISINLAIINLIPFPALDGGRLLFLLIEKIKGSKMNPKAANTANGIGFVLLLLLMLFVTYKDITKLF